MSDLISRQSAIDAVGNMLRRKFGIGGDLASITLAGLPSAQPTVDAVERKRGEWIKMSDADGTYLACSICGENLPRVWRFLEFDLFPKLKSIDKTNYCPNCGADMRGEG